jgi:cytochrome P450
VTDLVCHVIAALNDNPNVEQSLFEELKVVDIHTATPDIHKLPYLNQVIKETMRVYPLNPLLGRVATTDVDLDNLHVPKGTEMLISCTALHQVGWKDPEV